MDGQPVNRTRTAAQVAGDAAEALVAGRLIASGWTVLARNVHVGRHELDLVAVDPGPPQALVIVEVRWRRSRAFGLAEETVDRHKRRRLHHAAWTLVERGTLPDGAVLPNLPVRFDVAVVEPSVNGRSPVVRRHRAAF